MFRFWEEYGRKAETLKGIAGRSGACGFILLNTGKLARSSHGKDWQTDISFLVLRVGHGRS